MGQPALVGELIAGIALGCMVARYPGSFPHLAGLPENSVFATITALGMFFRATPYSFEEQGGIYFIQRPQSVNSAPIMKEVHFQYVEVDQVLQDLRQAYSRVNQPNVGFGPLPDKTGIYVVAPPDLLDQIPC